MISGIVTLVFLAIHVGLIVHVFRTGRPIYWAFIIFFFPLIGSLAYFFVELLPELQGDPRARRAMRSLRRTIDPEGDIRQLKNKLELEGSIDSARHLANELVANGRFAEAIEHYENALTGMYEQEPDLLLGLAEAQFGNSEFEGSKLTLERLAAENPDFQSATGHLLYARALEKCGQINEALDEYEAVSAYFAGAEARCRYATLLESENRREKALSLYRDIIGSADIAPRHFRKAQKTWIDRAREGVKRLSAA